MNVAFLANTFHLTQTRSSQFFIDLLEEWFGAVSVIAHQDVWARLPGTRWDLIVAWQHLFSPQELEAFGAKNTVLVPMFDDCPQDHEFWIRYRGFPVLCFSRTLANLLEPWGLTCRRVTYWPEIPGAQARWTDGWRGFFWPRTTSLDGRQVEVLARGARWKSFHLHVAHTPVTAVLPEPPAIDAEHFHKSAWFDGPLDYVQALAESNVFFAPRRFEGIGMANLEALALGMAVIAPDAPTANEYIVPGLNGALYDPNAPRPIDFSQAEVWGANARKLAIEGRAQWEASLPTIRAFLETPPSTPRRGYHPWILVRGRGWVALRAVYRQIKRWIKRGME